MDGSSPDDIAGVALHKGTRVAEDGLWIGWAQVDLTPQQPVYLGGQHYARISEGVLDPLTATAMVYESVREGQPPVRGGMVSCDFSAVPDTLRNQVRQHLSQQLLDLDPQSVFIGATHTHTAPDVRLPSDDASGTGRQRPAGLDEKMGVMSPDAYVAMASRRIADAIVQAWSSRQLGGVGFGLDHAVVGYNRRMAYYTGETKTRGNPNHPQFSHIEGGADATVNLFYTWNRQQKLTGVIVNIACPSQVGEHGFSISADFWHEAREEIRRQLGDDVFILPQNSAAGDICPGHPRTMIEWAGQQRMWRLKGIDQRRAIGQRIAYAVVQTLPLAQQEVDWQPTVMQEVTTVHLERNPVSPEDVQEANTQAAICQENYAQLTRELADHPHMQREARWYVPMTLAHGRMCWNQRVQKRFDDPAKDQPQPVTMHVLRIGEVAFATNPFELYLDYAHQIKARSKAVQTFIVQHVGPGTYLPTLRALAGKSYGAGPASVLVGPRGGRQLVDATVQAINALWPEPETDPES